MPPPLHRLVDAVVMWAEDRRPREPVGFHPPAGGSLECYGPLPPLPPPPREGRWEAPSPRPSAGDGTIAAVARRSAGRRRGTAVIVPPWKVPSLALVEGYARLAARAGLDAWTLVPPRHLQRSPAGVRSGEGFVSPDLRVLEEALAQLVVEIRLLAALARREGGPVAVVGLSLGALGAALAATGPEPIDRVALVAPPVDLAAVFAETPIGRRYLALAARAGAAPPAAERLRELLAPFRAELRAPTAARVLVAAGRDDRIARPAHALRLARAWGAAARVYPRGHLTLLFGCRALRRDLAEFLAA